MGCQYAFPYMFLTALVAKTPSMAVIVIVNGTVSSWFRTGARFVLEYRVQSACLMLLPVHEPATELTACSIRKLRVLGDESAGS
jgi:hypothetical protein